MDKKYELIKNEDGLIWIRALKDFILITGETVKKGDIGGCVVSEKCLSQEGNCWIMDYAYVSGKVSGNAIVKDFAKIYGKVSENAVIKDYARVCGIVSGNASVRDCACIEKNATATGNAVVQADQWIRYGIIATDLLGTNDLTGALYAELGIKPKNGKVILYKQVLNTNNPKIFKSWYEPSFIYEIGKEAVETDVDENIIKSCVKGLHFTSLESICFQGGNTILECEINVKDIITVQENKVRARKCRVIRVYKEE